MYKNRKHSGVKRLPGYEDKGSASLLQKGAFGKFGKDPDFDSGDAIIKSLPRMTDSTKPLIHGLPPPPSLHISTP